MKIPTNICERLRFHGRYASETNDECAARKNTEREMAADEIQRLTDRVRELEASERPTMMQVKKLEWEESSGNFDGQTFWSPKNDIWPCWIVKSPGDQAFVWCENLGADFLPASPVKGAFDTLEDAKIAAQADYEYRILSALIEPAETTLTKADVGTASDNPNEGFSRS